MFRLMETPLPWQPGGSTSASARLPPLAAPTARISATARTRRPPARLGLLSKRLDIQPTPRPGRLPSPAPMYIEAVLQIRYGTVRNVLNSPPGIPKAANSRYGDVT